MSELVERLSAKANAFRALRKADPALNFYETVALLDEAAAALFRAEATKTYIPGVWRCAKCNFRLVQSNLNARDGTVTPRDEPGEPCPNCKRPLWRVSWKDEAQENLALAENQMDRASRAEAQRDALAKALLEISLTSKGYPNGSREGEVAISALAYAEGKTPEQYLRDREALAAAADMSKQDDATAVLEQGQG